MNIKKILKENNYSLKDFAEEIKLSRPTLDSYINYYESNKTIPRERYQIVFDGLFKSNLDNAEFIERIKYYKNLFERDENLGTLSLYTGDADLVSKIHQLMLDDIKRDDCDKNIYYFISMLISSYRRNETFNYLAYYFSVLNNLVEMEDSFLDKSYLAYFYKVFKQIKDNAPEFNQKDFEDFLIRKDELLIERSERKKKRAMEIEQLVGEITDEYNQKGLELTKEQLIRELVNKS